MKSSLNSLIDLNLLSDQKVRPESNTNYCLVALNLFPLQFPLFSQVADVSHDVY